MSVNLVVAVTDGDWFDTLRRLPNLGEVNFWAPSGTNFRALQPGELFLFKLHAPRNFIVVVGIFAHANTMPCSLAWEAFGEANGAYSASEMRSRIARYRRADPGERRDFEIGCRILTQPFFLEENDWIPVPTSWSPNIVVFKTFNTAESEGLALWEAVQDRLSRVPLPGFAEEAARFGVYRRRCVITKERTLPALEAAHIRPYSDGGLHEASNGLLLRRDIHSLFDAGYVTVTPELKFEVSKRIRAEFENGRHYYALHGQAIERPGDPAHLPDRDALTWHNHCRFNG
jgi:putative restriction endonuclease